MFLAGSGSQVFVLRVGVIVESVLWAKAEELKKNKKTPDNTIVKKTLISLIVAQIIIKMQATQPDGR